MRQKPSAIKKYFPLWISILLLSVWLQACSVLKEPSHTKPAPGASSTPGSSSSSTAPSQTAVDPKTRPYQVNGDWYHPLADARGFEEKGIASWYGEEFHGRKTSNGETYDMYGISAAHKTLPLGTYVRVNNLENGRTLDLRVNDRGPFVRGRIIDLSYGAAQKLGIVEKGTASVRVTALGAPVEQPVPGQPPQYVPLDYYSGNFTFQVGAFADKTNAERLVQKLNQQYSYAHMLPYFDGNRTLYRVRVGRITRLEEAAAYEATLERNGFPETFIVAE
ncbi:MAG: septal ring lytic transglycosylase RlpA family protein [Desulfobacteraceae bacterium]|nr:septal ring lytic transglycosylase RlpA family protein [Desulfobacteraceae bacterium]